MAHPNHIYQLPQPKRHITPTTAILGRRGRGGTWWKKYIPLAITILLANEIIVSILINWKKTPSLVAPPSSLNPGGLPAVFDTTKVYSHTDIEEQHAKNKKESSSSPLLPSIVEIGNKQATNTLTLTQQQQAFIPNANRVQAYSFMLGDLSNETIAFASRLNTTDADLLRHACISYSDETKAHHISYRGVYGSWQGRTKDPHDRESLHLASRKNPWLKASFVYNSGVEDISSLVNSPVMFIPAIFDPSNCIHDLLFSLLPMAIDGKLKEFKAVAVKRPEYSEDDPVRDYSGDYCTLVLKELGWFQDFIVLPNNTCVNDGLWVPTIMYHRYPRGWSQKHAGRSSNEYIDNKDLPGGIMHHFHQQMWKAFLIGNKYMYKKKKTRIIFDSREGTGRSEWTNAFAVAEKVREELDPDEFVIEIVDDVGALTIPEQAALFYSASLLVAPHGSSIANAIFMKPTGIVFELICKEENSWIRDWVRDLRIRHAIVRADPLLCTDPEHMTYVVRPPDMASLIVDALWKDEKKKLKPA